MAWCFRRQEGANLLPVRLLLSLLLALPCAALAQDLNAPNAIHIFYTEIPPHLLATQLNITAGTGRLTRSDKPQLSGSAEIKGMYQLTGAVYLSAGGGLTWTRGHNRQPMPGEAQNGSIWLAYMPSGIGFTLGNDEASFITGIDVLPGYYFGARPELQDARGLTWGIGPEFGFLLRAGARYTKGLLIGMVGKLQFTQLPDKSSGNGLRYTYGGLGLMLRFY